MCFSAIVSLNQGLYTQMTQANGAKKTDLVILLLQKGIQVNLAFCALILPFLIYSQEILISIGIDATISAYAHTYIIYSIPGLIAVAIWDPIKVMLREYIIIIFCIHIFMISSKF